MRVGIVLPQGYFNEFDGWDPTKAWDRILELAVKAEELGFEALWTGEHVLAKWPGEATAFDCWTLSSALAAVVPRVDIGLIVVNSTFHHPAMLAKRAATLDSIADGRVTLGLGAGFKENEAKAFGYPYPTLNERMEMLTEHFEIIWRAQAMPASEMRHDKDSTMNFWPCASNTWYSWKPLGSRAPKVACFFARSAPNHWM